MKNIEKYYDEIERGLEINKLFECWIRYIRTGKKELLDCDGNCISCYAKNLKWLNAEYQEPIKLTHAEKVILENVGNYTHIKRFNGGKLGLGTNKLGWDLNGFDHLFQFIRWEDEAYEIKWLLENCEVEEDEK